MKDSKLQIDRSCHVLYSKPCKKEIRAKIALHYPAAEREATWEKVQRQYIDFLSDLPQAEIRGLQQAVLEEADVQGVHHRQKALRRMA